MSLDFPRPVRLLGISGSLRRDSHNTAVLRTIADNLAEKVALRIFPLADIPLYNQDEDGPESPKPVLALRQAIAEADGLVIVSPEFNYGTPEF